MRKLFILSLLAIMIAWGIGGCGGGSGGTSADPLGTDSLTLESAASQVNSNGAVALKATVKNAAGTAVVGREVLFAVVSNASGATLNSYSANTDGAGEVTILYRAGATAGSDVVRASISNGATMDVNITVAGSAGGSRISVNASTQSLAAGQNSILTATVTDGSGNLLSGQTVTFAFVTPTTIGSTITTINGVTDGSGQAVAVYTAGSTGTAGVVETIQAAVGVIGVNGSVAFVEITRSAGSATGYSMAIAANVTSLKAGESSVITATVTNAATGAVVGGQLVTFTFVTPTTIGSTLTTLNGTTDGSGRAIAVYTAGSTGTASIQETVKATVGTIGVDASTEAVTLTRTTSVIAPPAGYTMSVAAAATTLIAGQSTVITATVTNTDTGTVASGKTVEFVFVAPATTIGSTLTIVNGTTDGSGRAVAVYKAGSAGTSSVQEAIQASVGIKGVDFSANAVVITREVGGSGGVGVSLSLTADKTSLAPGESTIIRVTVVDSSKLPVLGQLVTFDLRIPNMSGATLTSLNETTDAQGKAKTVYTAGYTGGQDIVQAKVIIGGVATAADALVITVGVPKLSQMITLVAVPTMVTVGHIGNMGATATSGLAVTYSSLTTDVCTIISGFEVLGVKVGTCTIAADQSGNADYYAAPRVTQNIPVGP